MTRDRWTTLLVFAAALVAIVAMLHPIDELPVTPDAEAEAVDKAVDETERR